MYLVEPAYFIVGDQHTGADITAAVQDRCSYWFGSTAKVTAATSDNGLNMVNGLREAGFQYVFGCVAHTVHLSVDKGLKAARVSRVLAKARRVVEHFSKSSKSTYQLRKVQVDAGKSEQEVLVLVQDVPTRWTATYFMLKRLTDLGEFVHRVLADSDKHHIRELDLTAEDLYQLKELCSALAPLSAAMQSIGGESYCSLSLVEPLLHKLCNKVLVGAADDTPVVYDFKAAALADLKERYTDQQIRTLLSVSTALDPRFRDFSYIRDANERQAKLQVVREAIIEKVAEIAAEINEPELPDTSAHDLPPASSSDERATEPPPKRTRGESDLISFLTEDSDQPDNQHERPPTEQQITAYYMQSATAATDPLSFWKGASAVCPSLAALARRLFSITGSSVPCERLFSMAGLIVNDLRGSLSPETVAMLLFLNKNNDL